MESQRIETGYSPRKHQTKLHAMMKRFNVLVCHRRFGKTVFSVNEMIDRAIRNNLKNPQYAYIAPNYGQAKRVAWDMFLDFTKDVPGVDVNISDLRIDIPRPATKDKIRFLLLGAENPSSIRGLHLDGVILDEYADMDPLVWSQVLRPALSDRIGWAVFIGTPKGQNHFYDIHEIAKKNPGDWLTIVYKASETKIVHEEELKAAKNIMAPEEYEQEYECSFTAALVGAYYGAQMDEIEKKGQIGNVPHDSHLLTNTAWDLGIGDSTAIWFFQQHGQEVRIIDYIEDSGKGLDYYAAELKKGERAKYNYERHYFPHDVKVRSLETGKSRIETLRNLGIRVDIIEKQSFEDGINAARLILPKCWFDAKRCERGIKALKNYERRWDSKNKIYSSSPLHNWASHSADAFRYLGLGIKDSSRSFSDKVFQRQVDYEYDIFKL